MSAPTVCPDRLDRLDRPAPGRLRLTVRGRLLVAALLALLPVLGFTAGRAVATESPGRADVVVTVGAGDTLWSIARKVSADSDPRDTMARLIDRNGLASAQVQVGQRLTLPASGG